MFQLCGRLLGETALNFPGSSQSTACAFIERLAAGKGELAVACGPRPIDLEGSSEVLAEILKGDYRGQRCAKKM